MNYLSRIYFGSGLAKLLLFSQISKQFPTVEKIYNEIKFGFCLESKVQTNDIRIFDCFQDIPLSYIIIRGLNETHLAS
jgi:hypothetical protein